MAPRLDAKIDVRPRRIGTQWPTLERPALIAECRPATEACAVVQNKSSRQRGASGSMSWHTGQATPHASTAPVLETRTGTATERRRSAGASRTPHRAQQAQGRSCHRGPPVNLGHLGQVPPVRPYACARIQGFPNTCPFCPESVSGSCRAPMPASAGRRTAELDVAEPALTVALVLGDATLGQRRVERLRGPVGASVLTCPLRPVDEQRSAGHEGSKGRGLPGGAGATAGCLREALAGIVGMPCPARRLRHDLPRNRRRAWHRREDRGARSARQVVG